MESHPAKACAAALSQQQALGPLNEEFRKLGLPQLAIRIGIHTGVGELDGPTGVGVAQDVLTGNIGCLSGKMKYGCMGDPVNLAGPYGPKAVATGRPAAWRASARPMAWASCAPRRPEIGCRPGMASCAGSWTWCRSERWACGLSDTNLLPGEGQEGAHDDLRGLPF